MTALVFPLTNEERQRATVTFYLLDSDESPIEGSRVVLYLPKTVAVADGVQYNNIKLGILGREAASAAAAAGGDATADDLGRQALSAARRVTASFSDAVVSLGDAASGDVVGSLTKVLQAAGFYSTGVGAGIRVGLGRTAHPHERSIFEGVNLRQFSFEFDLVPSDARDAERINQIVKFFRSRLYPEVLTGGLAYVHPTKFLLEYNYAVDGKTNKKMAHKIKPCFLSGVRTTFNPNGAQAYHADGEFMSTRIELSFNEERALERQDVEEGF